MTSVPRMSGSLEEYVILSSYWCHVWTCWLGQSWTCWTMAFYSVMTSAELNNIYLLFSPELVVIIIFSGGWGPLWLFFCACVAFFFFFKLSFISGLQHGPVERMLRTSSQSTENRTRTNSLLSPFECFIPFLEKGVTLFIWLSMSYVSSIFPLVFIVQNR